MRPRCRVQNETCGHRGRANDALYRIRRLMTIAHERLDADKDAKLGRSGPSTRSPHGCATADHPPDSSTDETPPPSTRRFPDAVGTRSSGSVSWSRTSPPSRRPRSRQRRDTRRTLCHPDHDHSHQSAGTCLNTEERAKRQTDTGRDLRPRERARAGRTSGGQDGRETERERRRLERTS